MDILPVVDVSCRWRASRREGVARPERHPPTVAKFMRPRPRAGCRSRLGRACVRQGSNADACGCRKRRQNAHGTEERQVLYELHPWFGRPVRLHEVIEKSGGKVFRCSCDDDAVGRWLELPGWMFDRVACAPIRTVAVPLVEVVALQALRLLLTVALRQRVSGDASSTALDLDAALASHDQTRREGDARATKASSSASDGKRADRAARRARLRQAAAETSLGGASVADPRAADRPDDAPSPRSRAERSSPRPAERVP
jgi:hypothetical protein